MSAQQPATTVDVIKDKLRTMARALAVRNGTYINFKVLVKQKIEALTVELEKTKAQLAEKEATITAAGTRLEALHEEKDAAIDTHVLLTSKFDAAKVQSETDQQILKQRFQELDELMKRQQLAADAEAAQIGEGNRATIAQLNTLLSEKSIDLLRVEADARSSAAAATAAQTSLAASSETIATLESGAEAARVVQSTTAAELNTINDLISDIEKQIIELPTVPNDAVDFQEFLDETKFGGMRKSRRNVKKSKKTIKALVRRKRTLKK